MTLRKIELILWITFLPIMVLYVLAGEPEWVGRTLETIAFIAFFVVLPCYILNSYGDKNEKI